MVPVIHAQIIDADRHHMGRFLMTGSQKFGLMQSLSESLAGRCAILELGTLSAAEIHRAPAHADLDPLDLLWRGGLRRDSVDHPIVNWLWNPCVTRAARFKPALRHGTVEPPEREPSGSVLLLPRSP